MKHEILSRSGAVLYECDVPDDMASGLRTRHALEQAVKSGANLVGANLTGANLTDANLTGANLTDANLTGANLTDANLTGANLTDANLTDAKWRDGIIITRAPRQVSGLRWTVCILDDHMQIGCELHSLAEWASFDDARIVKMDRQALRFWRAYKDALLALAAARERDE